jgi:hypothetical protein
MKNKTLFLDVFGYSNYNKVLEEFLVVLLPIVALAIWGPRRVTAI